MTPDFFCTFFFINLNIFFTRIKDERVSPLTGPYYNDEKIFIMRIFLFEKIIRDVRNVVRGRTPFHSELAITPIDLSAPIDLLIGAIVQLWVERRPIPYPVGNVPVNNAFLNALCVVSTVNAYLLTTGHLTKVLRKPHAKFVI